MNEILPQALTLLAPLPAAAHPLDGEWRVAFADPGQADDTAWAAPDFPDANWKKTCLPHLRYATAQRDTVWYRHRFSLEAAPSGHTVLRFGGAFYETRAWLNGVDLGSHQGYFQPFGYDLTQALKTGENVLAVRCRFPIEAHAFKQKTAVAGVFADWDCKPYPSMYYPNLPAPHEWRAPLGLWQPVHLQTSGALLIEAFNVFPEQIQAFNWEASSAESAVVRIVLQVRNLTALPQKARLHLALAPHNFEGQTAAAGDWEISLQAQARQPVEFTLPLPQPRLWFPWTHGTPHLYRAALSLEQAAHTCELLQVFGVRSIEAHMDAQTWSWRLNGRRIFPRGSNYFSGFYLDQVSQKDVSRDLVLAREANLDLLRVHAHIGPPDLYRLCDEMGLLVMCDFPLIWTYAYNLPPEEQAAFAASVRRQTGDMVGLLGSHPSISLWTMHNEPPWSPDGSFLGADVHASQTNREMDEAMAHQVRLLDTTRPVLAASGQFDQHLYHGWYTGHWRDNRSLQPTFPTEFGVQALPNLDSPFWETVNTHWPVSGDDPTWAYAGYQAMFWDSPGVGAPAQYPTLAAYIQEGQAYQAFYIRYTIDQWRRKKFQPVGGYIHFLFADGWPAITWAVLDDYRRPKAGYRALAEASRPAHVCIDLPGEVGVEGAFHLVYPQGGRFKADLYLVNDDYRLSGRARLRWWLVPKTRRALGAWLRRWLAPRISLTLPQADESARRVKSVEIPLPRSGEYTFHTLLTQAGRVLDENHTTFYVGTARAAPHAPHRVPGFLVSRVYEVGSLRHTADGFTLRFHNPAMPVLVQRLLELQVDGRVIDLSQIEVIHAGQSLNATAITPETPLELSTNEHFTLLAHAAPLAPGRHELEMSGQVLGLGSFSARWSDSIV